MASIENDKSGEEEMGMKVGVDISDNMKRLEQQLKNPERKIVNISI